MSSAYRSAASSWERFASSRCPTGSPSKASTGRVITLSHVMTQASGNPCSGPISTSDGIPRMVRVIGAHVTELRTSIAAFRVRTQTGLRPAGGPRSAQKMSLRATTPALFEPQFVLLTPRGPGQVAGAGTRAEAVGPSMQGLQLRESLGPLGA